MTDPDVPIILRVSQEQLADIVSKQRLFGSWIEQTKALQESHYGMKFENMSQDELERWFLVNAYSASEEIHEAGAELSWKPWAKSEFFHREAFLGEIVDALHFIGNLLAGAQVTDDELNEAYLEKMERNRKRQEEGYTGLEKCGLCKRAVDDIIAHGGYMTQGYYARVMGTQGIKHIQFCDTCHPSDYAYSPELSCDICGKRPDEVIGYVFQQYDASKSETVHTSGYGCSKCHCDSGDDWK